MKRASPHTCIQLGDLCLTSMFIDMIADDARVSWDFPNFLMSPCVGVTKFLQATIWNPKQWAFYEQTRWWASSWRNRDGQMWESRVRVLPTQANQPTWRLSVGRGPFHEDDVLCYFINKGNQDKRKTVVDFLKDTFAFSISKFVDLLALLVSRYFLRPDECLTLYCKSNSTAQVS